MKDILNLVKEHQKIWKEYKSLEEIISFNKEIISSWINSDKKNYPPFQLEASINASARIIDLFDNFKIIHNEIVELLNGDFVLFDAYLLLNDYLEAEDYVKADLLYQKIKLNL